LAAIDAGRVSEETADDWLSTWVDEIGYYVPYRNITDYRQSIGFMDNLTAVIPR
jgi:hypothetical protein